MAVTIASNVLSLGASRSLSGAQFSQNIALQRLSSGLRINAARDDAAGLSIASQMTARIRGLSQGGRNANDGLSLLQTAESAMASVSESLQRMRELAIQAANGTNSDADRRAINAEFQQQLSEIRLRAADVNFNGKKILDGSVNSVTLWIGASATDSMSIEGLTSMSPSQLGSTGDRFTTTVIGDQVAGTLGRNELTLNGADVGPAMAGAGAGQSADSAYAAAASINAGATDVTATAETKLVGVSSPSLGSLSSGTFSINGVGIDAIAAGADAASQGANVAAAIQGASAQTGVTAHADAISGVLTLTAIDGRNVDIGLNGIATSPAEADANRATLVNLMGLSASVVGSQAVAPVAGQKQINTGNVTLSNVGNSFAINGVNFKITDSLATSVVVSASLVNLSIDIAGASNNSSVGVATALSAAIQIAQVDPRTAAALSGLVVSSISSNVLVSDANPGASSTTISTTGTNASVSTPIAGRAAVSAQVTHNHGNLALSCTSPNGISVGGAMPGAVGLSSGTTNPAQSSSVIGIDTTNTLTVANAQNAIRAMDSAISQVGEARGALGAYMNRLQLVVEGIQNTVGNTTTARSRILDADYASESAALIRSSILCNASLAMVAQANAAPRMALTLLRSL